MTGVTIDPTGDVFVSYNSTTASSGQEESIAEIVGPSGELIRTSVIGTPAASADPGALTMVTSSAALPSPASSGDILELQPDGQLFLFNSESGTSSQYDNLASYTANASGVYDVQSGGMADLSGKFSLATATFGDFGVYDNSLVFSADSNNWDFVVRLTYGSSGGVATVLAASPLSDGVSASPQGVAVDSQGTVLTTLPFVPAGSTTAINVPVGFSLFYDTGGSPTPVVPALGLTTVPSITSSGIAVDSQNNFILVATSSSLYGDVPGVVHINSAHRIPRRSSRRHCIYSRRNRLSERRRNE